MARASELQSGEPAGTAGTYDYQVCVLLVGSGHQRHDGVALDQEATVRYPRRAQCLGPLVLEQGAHHFTLLLRGNSSAGNTEVAEHPEGVHRDDLGSQRRGELGRPFESMLRVRRAVGAHEDPAGRGHREHTAASAERESWRIVPADATTTTPHYDLLGSGGTFGSCTREGSEQPWSRGDVHSPRQAPLPRSRLNDPMPAAAVAETHISVLFFVGDRVFKLRKPVRFGFLDFTEPTARKLDCERELALNRRLAPDVYLGVADVLFEGEPVDHMVVMRRLPEDRRLATLARRGGDISDHLRQVAHALVTFHAGALRSAEISSSASAAALGGAWESNFAQTDSFVGSELDERAEERLRGLAGRYLEGRGPLFASRISSGRVCDGHGDLQAEDIFCLDDGPRILDCIEFDDTLRYGDVISDVSFLATDLERLGRFDAADQLLRDYQELAGDRFPESLVHHHSALHAYVRAKVGCLRHAQGERRASREARRLQGLALEHLELGRVRLVLVGGLPGTGKSTVAAALGAARGWVVLRSDEVRKELAGVAPTSRAPTSSTSGEPAAPAYRGGIYGAEQTAATYRLVLDRAREALGLGESVVLDASWSESRWRRTAADIAARSSSDLVELCCTLDPHEASRRLVSRDKHGADVSDATPEIAALMAREFAVWPSAVIVDTSVSPDAVVARALEIVDDRR